MSAEEASIPYRSDVPHGENLRRPGMRDFEEVCASGDIETATDIVNGNGIPYNLDSGLREALRTEKLDLARFLLEKGLRFNWLGKNEAMSMAKCTMTNSCLDLLVEYGFDINAPDLQGDSLLMDINILIDEARVKWLLEHGADPNLHPSHFGSVLDVAAEVGTVAVIDLLLQHGASLENSFPLHNAACMGPRDAARLSRVLPPEHIAVVGDRIPVMKYLLEIGVDVNAPDDSHHRWGSPLHCAIIEGPPANVRFLLEHGADPSLKDTKGRTAFEVADQVKNGMDEILKEFSPPK